MAVESGPNLSTARAKMFELMSDVCVIRAPEITASAVLDPDTGELVAPDTQAIYDETTRGHEDRPLGGRCKVTRTGVPGVVTSTRGDDAVTISSYKIDIPWDAPNVPLGATVTITSSYRDEHLAGVMMKVVDVVVKTLLIQRTLIVEEVR